MLGNIPYAAHMASVPSNPIFDLLPKLQEPGFISFAAGVPSPDSFPYGDIERICAKVLKEKGDILLQYGSTEGYPAMRESACTLFERVGLKADPKDVFITTGGQQMIDLLCKLLIEPGDVVLVEKPTYSATLQIMSAYKTNPVGLESDENGVLVEDLERKLEEYNPKFVYIIPSFQNPSGRTLALERRERIAQLTAKKGVLLVEDDPYRELRYEGEHLPTIKSFETGKNILYMTSLSKILCPGLRVGATLCPSRDLLAHLTVAKQTADMHSSNLPQAIVDGYLREGLLGPHIDEIRGLYRVKLKAMLDAIKAYFPAQIQTTRPQGGLFIFATLPEGVDTTALLPVAVDKKVAFIPGEPFFTGEKITNTMRLNFSNASLADIDRGAQVLGALLKKIV